MDDSNPAASTASTPPVPAAPIQVPPKPPQRSILDVGTVCLLLLTLGGSCGAWHWSLDLMSHFRCYYVGFAVLFLIGLWRRKSRSLKWCIGLVLAWNGGLIFPYYMMPVQSAPSATATKISLISLNVYTANKNKRAVVEYLRERQPDLIVVMEVDINWGAALQELDDIYPHRLFQLRSDNFGIGLLSKWPLTKPHVVDFADNDLPSIVASIQRDSAEFQIIATHPLPPAGASRTRERNAQLRAVAEYVKRSSVPCIVAGDFNATPWSFAFRDFAARSGLKDTALGHGVQGSWNAKSWFMRIPIDHVMVPPGTTVIDRSAGPNVGSDHFPIEATIALQ